MPKLLKSNIFIKRRRDREGNIVSEKVALQWQTDADPKPKTRTFPIDLTKRRKRETAIERAKQEAREYLETLKRQWADPRYVDPSHSVTVRELADRWIMEGRTEGKAPTTILQREQHARLHIVPLLGDRIVSELKRSDIRDFRARLREEGRSTKTVNQVTQSLSSMLQFAMEQEWIGQNVARGLKALNPDPERGEREDQPLEVGVTLPTPDEVWSFIDHLPPRWLPILYTAIWTGMRGGELRALRWEDVDFERQVITVRRNLDQLGNLRTPKTKTGCRIIPIHHLLTGQPFNLREWWLQYPAPEGEARSLDHLVFPNGRGRPECHANITRRGVAPTWIRAGIILRDPRGQPQPKYGGRLHIFRHFFTSWALARKEDGGLGLSVHQVQKILGHKKPSMTQDVYGHLLSREYDGDEFVDGMKRMQQGRKSLTIL